MKHFYKKKRKEDALIVFSSSESTSYSGEPVSDRCSGAHVHYSYESDPSSCKCEVEGVPVHSDCRNWLFIVAIV